MNHMNQKINFILFIFVLVFVGGCVAKARISPTRTVEFEEDRLVQAYLETGKEYENKGNLVEAWKYYQLAYAVNPESQLTKENIDRLQNELRRSAEKHYQAGLRYYDQGRYRAARREFLMTLGLWPNHQEALQKLSIGKRIQAKRYVVHTIAPGESLSKLAMMYYGDYKKFPIIAKYNGIADAMAVRVGQKIKVPEVEGVQFLVADQNVSIEQVTGPSIEGLEEATEKQPEDSEEETYMKPVDVVAMYRSHGIGLFNKGEYQGAIIEFRKVINVESDDAIAIDYLYKSHYQQAMVSFAKKDYLSAKRGFEESLRYKGDCEKCNEYIMKSEDEYKELHYAKGLSYFGDEKLAEALREWELVQAVDPDYEDVEQHITKVKKHLKKLEEIQESQREKPAR